MPPAIPAIAAGVGLVGTLANASAAKKQASATAAAAKENTKAAKAAAEAAGKPQEIHQTTEEIVHKSPVEIGSAGVEGFDLANQWATFMAQSRDAGMSGGMFGGMGDGSKGVGQFVLQGVDKLSGLGDGAAKDAEYASYDMQRKARQAQDVKISALGIDNGSGNNPGGIKMSLDDFVAIRTAKDPSGLVTKGLSVNDPIQDDEWADVTKSLTNGDPSPTWQKRYQLVNMMANDPQLGGDGLTAMMADPGWGEAINYWKSQGVINSANLADQGQLQQHYSKLMNATKDNRTMAALTPELKSQLQNEYNTLSAKVADPKLIKKSDMGDGVTKTELMNADGTVASSFMEGSVRLPSGYVMRNVEVAGSNLSDFEAFQELAGRTGALFESKKSAAGGAFTKSSSSSSKKSSKKPEGYDGASLNKEEDQAPETLVEGFKNGSNSPMNLDNMDVEGVMQLFQMLMSGAMGGDGSDGGGGGSDGDGADSEGASDVDSAGGSGYLPQGAPRSASRSGPPTTAMPSPMQI